MFTLISNDHGARSDEGFDVYPISHVFYKYLEKQGEMDIHVEWGIGKKRRMVYVFDSGFYEWKDGRKIPEEKKQQILQNFTDAMDFLGFDVVAD